MDFWTLTDLQSKLPVGHVPLGRYPLRCNCFVFSGIRRSILLRNRGFGLVLACIAAVIFASTISGRATSQTRCLPAAITAPNAHSLTVSSASFVGLGLGDRASGVAIAPDCAIVLGVTLSNVSAFADTTNITNPLAPTSIGGNGAILKLSPDGSQLVKRAKIGGAINDIAVNPTNGDIAIAADIGVVVLAADLATVRWSDLSQVAARIDISHDGVVVALRGGTQAQAVGDNGAAKTYTIYNANGTQRYARASGYTHVADIAVDAITQRVFMTGYAQRDGGSCTQLQNAWLKAFDYDGNEQWVNYDYARGVPDANGDCADTRGRRVAVGEDGMVYFAGTSAGGNTIFRWLPSTRQPSVTLNQLGTSANNAKPGSDNYVDPFNTASNHITYVARFEPRTGQHLVGFFLLSRNGQATDANPRGNTIEPRAIAGDKDGRFYIGGYSAYQIKNRPDVSLNGSTTAAYAGSDAWILVTSPDVRQRETWVTFNNGGKGSVRGIVASRGAAAIAVYVEQGAMFTTANALQSTAPATIPSGGTQTQSSGYFALWSAQTSASPVACNLDADANNGVRMTTDATLAFRYILGRRGGSLVTSVKQGALNNAAIEQNLGVLYGARYLDIDGNGVIDAATDGVLLLRALLGFRDEALIANALGTAPPNGTWRNTATAIRTHLSNACGLPL
jgi:hypothetical protein